VPTLETHPSLNALPKPDAVFKEQTHPAKARWKTASQHPPRHPSLSKGANQESLVQRNTASSAGRR
jgi:hypothetical protein